MKYVAELYLYPERRIEWLTFSTGAGNRFGLLFFKHKGRWLFFLGKYCPL